VTVATNRAMIRIASNGLICESLFIILYLYLEMVYWSSKNFFYKINVNTIE